MAAYFPLPFSKREVQYMKVESVYGMSTKNPK